MGKGLRIVDKCISYKASTTGTTSSPTSGYIPKCMPVLAADCEWSELGTITYQDSPFEGQRCAVHETKDGNKIATTCPAQASQRRHLRNLQVKTQVSQKSRYSGMKQVCCHLHPGGQIPPGLHIRHLIAFLDWAV